MASESTLEASASYSANLSNNPALDDGCNYKNGRTLTPPTTVSTEGYVISSGNQVRRSSLLHMLSWHHGPKQTAS